MGDSREKWLINDSGNIMMYKDSGICITSVQDDHANNLCNKATAEASSDLGDNVHYASRAIDGVEGAYWASEPGKPTASFTVNFD
jgi:hypothetical protein